MGRSSKLTDAQWEEIKRRHLSGETARALGREFGVSETAIRKKFGAHQNLSSQSSQVRSVAEKLVEANTALAALPPSQRPVAISLAERLQSISDNLVNAAHHGAATAHRLNALANSEVAKIDDAEPLQSQDSLKGVMVLTRLANDSAAIALNLLAANKDTVARINAPTPPRPSIDPAKLSDATLTELLDARG